jgi:hypothetical protein
MIDDVKVSTEIAKRIFIPFGVLWPGPVSCKIQLWTGQYPLLRSKEKNIAIYSNSIVIIHNFTMKINLQTVYCEIFRKYFASPGMQPGQSELSGINGLMAMQGKSKQNMQL